MSFCLCIILFFFFKQKTAYEMRISDWSSDVCSSDLFATPKVLDDLKRRGRNRGRCDIAQEAGAYLVERHGALMLRQQCLGRLNARPLSRLLHIVPPATKIMIVMP